jgi:predicted SAM-dependent methyltransferase
MTVSRLHLGCGTRRLDGWLNADAVARTGVDLVLDVRLLHVLESETFDWIYSSHMIEHIHPDLLPGVLTNLFRALRPGAKLTLATISLEGIYRNAYQKSYQRDAVNAYLYGDSKSTDDPFQAHRQVFTEAWLTESLRAAGFSVFRTWSLSDYPEIAALGDCASSSWHVTLYLEAVK